MKIFGKLSSCILMICFLTVLPAVDAFATPEETLPDIDPIGVFDSVGELTVYVDGELSNALSGTYPAGTTVKLDAPVVSGKSFRYWTDAQGTPVSYQQSLDITMYSDTLLDAVYGDAVETDAPVASFLSVTRDSSQILFNGIATVPAGSDITATGIRYSRTKDTPEALKEDGDVTDKPALNKDKRPGDNWIISVEPTITEDSVDEEEIYYAIAYVETAGKTYYSDMVAVKLSGLNYGMSAVSYQDIERPNLSGGLYTVTFVANGGEGAMEPQGAVGGRPIVLSANTFACSDKVFGGWNTSADGSGKTYADRESISLEGNITLFAQWNDMLRKAPKPKSLSYSGAAQELVEAGVVEGGEMRYALGTDNKTAPTSGWSTDIPTATEAGTYYIWYKVVGDSNHTDSKAACIITTIKAAEPKPEEPKPEEPKPEEPKTEEPKPVEKIKLNVKANDQIIMFGDQIKTDASAYEITGLETGDTAEVTLKADTTLFTITPSVTIKSSNDVTAKYDITTVSGMLTVKKVPMLKALPRGKGITVTWDKVAAADGYDIYAAYCGKNTELIKSINGKKIPKYTYKKLNSKDLNLNKASKVYVVAYKIVDGKKIGLQSSALVHVAGVNMKKTNAKRITLTKSRFTLNVGKAAGIKAKIRLVKKKYKQLSDGHAAALRYASSDNSVATVDSKGKITAVGSGTCTVYIYAVDGVYKKATVVVK